MDSQNDQLRSCAITKKRDVGKVDLIWNETWQVDQPCRAWESVDSCIKQTCLTEGKEGFQSALPPYCPWWSITFSFEPWCHIQFILPALWPHSCLCFTLSSTEWWMGLYCLKPPRSQVFIISAVWRWSCLWPLCWNWVETFFEEANSRAQHSSQSQIWGFFPTEV